MSARWRPWTLCRSGLFDAPSSLQAFLTRLVQRAPDVRPAHRSGSPTADLSGWSRTDLLERGEELARIEAALAQARAGAGRFVVIEGPAGIGKTAVLASVRAAAADGGMRVMR